MYMKKIVIAGGSGFMGTYLSDKFRAEGSEVIIIGRKNTDVSWTDQPGITAAVNNADLVINLAGKSVDCRYNDKNKREILESRTKTTRVLGEAIRSSQYPPKLWINSSTATIYRHAEDRPMTEKDGEIGSGFSVNVAKDWERSFFNFNLQHTRQVALRTAIVLGKNGGALKPLTTLTKLGFGGKQGKGNQMFSWIHIEDFFQIVKFVADHNEITGAINCSAPEPVKNKVFMQTLRDVLHIPFGLPSPSWLLKAGAVFIRTETELILKSRWVLPQRLLESGYTFRYPTLRETLEDIIE
jgi:uncharacterized protein